MRGTISDEALLHNLLGFGVSFLSQPLTLSLHKTTGTMVMVCLENVVQTCHWPSSTTNALKWPTSRIGTLWRTKVMLALFLYLLIVQCHLSPEVSKIG